MKQFGASIIPVIQMRKEPSHTSELISQMLFGELFEINTKQGSWMQVTSISDLYIGWIDTAQSYLIDETEFHRLTEINQNIVNNTISSVRCIENNRIITIPMGSILYGNNSFKIGDFNFEHEHQQMPIHVSISEGIITQSLKCLNAPYLWGGKTIMGFDCSGFVQVIFRMSGINLPRDASQQVMCGTEVFSIDIAENGDLAFFGDENNISHVGIIQKPGMIIHCSGMVRQDEIDHHGIISIDTKQYTHKLRTIRRILTE